MVLFQRLLIALCLAFLPISMSQLVVPWGNDRRPVCDCVSDRQSSSSSYVVRILVKQQTYSPCGGSLITERHVLCSAHCFYGHQARDFSCIVNDIDIRYRQVIRVQTIRIHQSFQYSSYTNNIAILELAQSVTVRGGLKMAVIPNRGYNLSPGASLTSLGWGQLGSYNNKKKGAQVQTAVIKVSDPKACQGARKSGQKQPKNFDGKSQICASGGGGGGKKKGRSGCDGGSGGVIRKESRFDIMFGLSYGGQGMCYPYYDPGYYTRVSYYGQWIYSMTKSARCAFCVSR